MTKYLEFQCGCKFEIKQEFEDGRVPLIHFSLDKINYDCPATWKILEQGFNAGIFQLESRLGRYYCKELKPTSIDHLSALGAILRPSCLDDRDEKGISTTQHFCNRKNGKEPVNYIHPELESILNKTYGINIYQESSLEICKKIAGFSLQEADSARKAIGKKLAEEMSKVKKKFIEGAKRVGKVDEKTAEAIFVNIETSQRYQFNKCLSPSTLIDTKEGLKEIDNIEIGENILAPNYITKQDEYVEVKNKYENGERDLYEIALESGKTLQCTLNHKLMCEDGIMRELGDILIFNQRIICEDE